MISNPPPAVVVGLCAHGLAVVRELHQAGIPVIAIESDRSLPGIHTRMADVRLVDSINAAGIHASLLELVKTFPHGIRPVLFLTSDRMVQAVGEKINSLRKHYIISWADCSQTILSLLDKSAIEARCRTVGLNYPASAVARTAEEAVQLVSTLRLPIILKPLQPLSSFKTLVIARFEELATHQTLISSALPVLLQEFIPGGDSQIHFGALCLDRGTPVARFEGRKLHSRPMGHTTIGISHPSDEVHLLTLNFFEGLMLSGTVSLELKRAPDESLWVIEPTLGRTDFWSDLCAANGVPLAASEYRTALGNVPETPPTQQKTHVWINAERFPAALPWLLKKSPDKLLKKIRFTYLDHNDLKPFLYATRKYALEFSRRLLRKTKKIIQNSFHRNGQ